MNSSSAPNGSSISSSVGAVASARAIDTRICMPPDSSRGKRSAASASPTPASASRAAASAAARGTCARSSGRRTFAATRAHGISVGDWNTIARRRAASSAGTASSPHQRMRPAVGASSPATIRSSVVLPQPEGPSSVTNSPARTARSTGSSARVPLP